MSAVAEVPVAEKAAVAPVFTGRTRHGGFALYDRIAGISPALWQSFFAPHWKDRRYYQTLEETLTTGGFEQRYLVLKDETGLVRAIQPVFFVEQDLTVSLPAAAQSLLQAVRRLWPRCLRLRLLMVGCIVGDCQIGAGENPDWPWLCAALDEALSIIAQAERVSLILFKDVPAGLRGELAGLCDKKSGGYVRFPSLPAVRLPLGFADFEDYLQNRLGKATRKSLRRKFREVEEAGEPISLEVRTHLSDEDITAAHQLYESVAQRGDFQFEVFTRDYFSRLSRRMPEQAHFFLWRQAGKLVAFSFCMVFGDAIYDNDIGLDYSVAHGLHLYYVTFRDIIHWAATHGLRNYYSSPFNYHPKLRLRMELVPLDLYARHRSRWMQPMLRWLAPMLGPTRREPVLRDFPNSNEV